MKVTYDFSYQYKKYPFSPRATAILGQDISSADDILLGTLAMLFVCGVRFIGQSLAERIAKRDTETYLINNPHVLDAIQRSGNIDLVLDILADNFSVGGWKCSNCGMINAENIGSCQKCGVTKRWSDEFVH